MTQDNILVSPRPSACLKPRATEAPRPRPAQFDDTLPIRALRVIRGFLLFAPPSVFSVPPSRCPLCNSFFRRKPLQCPTLPTKPHGKITIQPSLVSPSGPLSPAPLNALSANPPLLYPRHKRTWPDRRWRTV